MDTTQERESVRFETLNSLVPLQTYNSLVPLGTNSVGVFYQLGYSGPTSSTWMMRIDIKVEQQEWPSGAGSAPVQLELKSDDYEASPSSRADARCQPVLDTWCRLYSKCIAEIAADKKSTALVARYGLRQETATAPEWRCYSPSVLDHTMSKFTGGAEFCSADKQLSEVLAICNGTLPNTTSYPLPPGADGAGGACEPAHASAHTSALIMPAGLDGVSCYRIPSVIGPFPPHSNSMLAFAEAREKNCADSGIHALGLVRSTDRGATWGSMQFLYNDSNPQKDGLNLGASVFDATTKTVHVLVDECADAFGKPPCGPTASLLQLSSTDFGATWGPPRNITSDMVAGGFAMLNPGPGTGIQLAQAQSQTGRLLVPAWGPRLGHGSSQADWNAAALYSSDNGKSWKVSGIVPTSKAGAGSRPNELQCASLADGTVVLNARDEASPYRLISTSSDGGESWSAFKPNAQLVGAICQGSMVSLGSTLFFSHPFASSRSNGWIKFSTDAGKSWWLWRQVDPGAFGYSSATVVASNTTHVTIGVVYEGAQGLRYTAITGFLPQRAA